MWMLPRCCHAECAPGSSSSTAYPGWCDGHCSNPRAQASLAGDCPEASRSAEPECDLGAAAAAGAQARACKSDRRAGNGLEPSATARHDPEPEPDAPHHADPARPDLES